MHNLRAKLPPANSLIVFEAAARHLSFTAAAAELEITQAAVSRQIKRLEEHLGRVLFRRRPRALELTPEGQLFGRRVSMGLEYIAFAVMELEAEKRERALTVGSNTAVAHFWLRPRIAAFLEQSLDVDVSLVGSDQPLEFVADGIDVEIRYGAGLWPGTQTTKLFDEEVFPVCSPGYLATCQPMETPTDLLHQTLLHMERHGPDWVTWSGWLREHGVEPPETLHGITFNSYPTLVQACVEGQGVAMGSRGLTDELLASGLLIQAMEATVRTGRGYYLCLPEGVTPRHETSQFCDWLLDRHR